MTRRQQAETGVMEDIPSQINESEILYYLQKKAINWQYVDAIKKLTDFNDDKLADWLNMSVKNLPGVSQAPEHIQGKCEGTCAVAIGLGQAWHSGLWHIGQF